MKGRSASGCTHQIPHLAYNTIRCSGRNPPTRPSMVAIRSGPPSPARGTLVNSMKGSTLDSRERQPNEHDAQEHWEGFYANALVPCCTCPKRFHAGQQALFTLKTARIHLSRDALPVATQQRERLLSCTSGSAVLMSGQRLSDGERWLPEVFR